jgi:hypothetical protein
MANYTVNKFSTEVVTVTLLGKVVEQYDGPYFTNYNQNWIIYKIERYQSDCKYYRNPGFVCPLSAYRPSGGLFFING